jgi:glycosyltransferase involved in cell wall biosynthesis
MCPELHKSSRAEGDGAILFVLNALGIGGSERKTVAVVNELRRTGYEVHLAYLDDRTPLLKMVHDDVPVIYLERQGKFSLSAIRKLRAYLQSTVFSRVVCVSLYPFLYAQAAVWTVGDRVRPSITVSVNATEHFDWKSRIQMSVYAPLLRRANQVIFGCRTQKKLWTGRYDLDEKKCRVIYNGIDWQYFSPDREYDFDDLSFKRKNTDFVFGAVGTLWANKNHIELVHALARVKSSLPNARLVIAGEGPERIRIEEAAREYGLESRVTLLGEIYDVRPLLASLDVFVLPSISETFSNAALEAMAMQKVVILSNVGGNPEMVKNGVDGYCYERGDVDALSALLKSIAEDPEGMQRVGLQARNSVAERFSFARMVDDYRDMLGQAKEQT